MLYYFVEFAGSFANIALLLLFIGRLFPQKEPISRWFYVYVALFIAGQCALSLFPNWVTQRTVYLLVGGFLLALLFYEVRPWQAVFASGAFFTLAALVEVFAMLLIGLRIPDTDILMQAGAARLIYVVFSNLIQILLVVLVSHFFSRKGNALRILWLLPIIAIQVASIAVCYVAQYHAADEYFPDYMVGLMAVLLLINILIVFYVEALRENELEKFKVKFNEQQYNLQMEYYQQLKERQEEVRSLRHDVKKYILAMQAVAEHGDTEELHKIAQAATDIFERSTNVSAVGNPVYVIKNDKLYYKRDILEIPQNCKCKLTVECVHSESAYPTVPTLSIPNGYNGYITVNAEKYPQIPNLSTKKSSKLSIRIAEKYPGHLFCESNTGLLAVSFQSWIPAELKMSRWWESTAFPDLAMTRTEIAPNKIQYACNAAGRRVEFQDKPSDFDKYVFTVEWETLD